MKQDGFTLLELIIVIAIIGILSGIFGWNLIRNIRTAELREAANQVATDLRRSRSQAQRSSSNVVLVLPNSAGDTKYKVDATWQDLPNGVLMLCKTTCGSGTTTNVTYQAPYGELGAGATGSAYTLKSPMNGVSDLEIRIVGVTGKVILTKAGS